ncbi:hypothetical protein [Pseudoxanthomonas sp.]|uniref:hypothetical protein n=1 Tax=Pseudoxanthomonas sp. TaxID=1871049 RepID=UPI003F80AA59
MNELDAYVRAMVSGTLHECVRIERKHGLYGLSPEAVSVGLKAFDEGRNVDDAVDRYLSGEGSDDAG